MIRIICCGLFFFYFFASSSFLFPLAFGCIQFHGASKLFAAGGSRMAKHRFHHRRGGEIGIKRFEIYEVEGMGKKITTVNL